jgi:hypothetical protein
MCNSNITGRFAGGAADNCEGDGFRTRAGEELGCMDFSVGQGHLG